MKDSPVPTVKLPPVPNIKQSEDVVLYLSPVRPLDPELPLEPLEPEVPEVPEVPELPEVPYIKGKLARLPSPLIY